LSLLAEVGRALTDTLDYRTSFRTLARLLVPTLSEIAIIDLLEEDGSSQRAAVAHTDETREAQLFELHQDYAQLRPAHPLAQVLRSGQPIFYPEIPPALVEEVAHDVKQRELLASFDVRSLIVVPLIARGRTLGAITLARVKDSVPFDARDLKLAEQLGRRAGVALDNLRLYEA